MAFSERIRAWSWGEIIVFGGGGALAEIVLLLVIRATAPPLVRFPGVDYFYEDHIEPLLHFGSWVLLVAIPLLVLAVAWLRSGTTASDP